MLKIALLVFAAMAAKDISSNVSIYLVSRRHGLWAGIADGVSDIAAVFSVGVTAVVTTSHGFSVTTVVALTGLLAGSIVGGVVGTRLGHHVANELED